MQEGSKELHVRGSSMFPRLVSASQFTAQFVSFKERASRNIPEASLNPEP